MLIHDLLVKKATILSPVHLEVINESDDHSGNQQESHFKVIIVSDAFANVKLIDRHRQVQKLYKEEITLIHAFTLHTYTPDEWSIKKCVPLSPKCGGS